MNSVKLDSKFLPPRFDPDKYASEKMDWTGRRLSRNHTVTRQLSSRPDGVRFWEVTCSRCGHGFALSEAQLIDHYKIALCACR
jgi:hypothetical protein